MNDIKLINDILKGEAVFESIKITSTGQINVNITFDSKTEETVFKFIEPRPNVSTKRVLNFGGKLDYVKVKGSIAKVKIDWWPEMEISL